MASFYTVMTVDSRNVMGSKFISVTSVKEGSAAPVLTRRSTDH